ncbi:MAG: EAL domain-containing protein [Gemmatimonadota bacterium]|nr:EAL domain-containing protein [Gemmatimonadota bacterium]
MSESAPATSLDIFVARQPIFDAQDRVAGYELLYRRSGEATRADGLSSLQMSSEVLIHAMIGIGMEKICGSAPAFLNFTREQLLEGTYELIDPNACVIEFLESVPADPEVLAAAQKLKAKGYTIALDDFATGENQVPLIPYASIIKIDVLNRPMEHLEAQVASLKPFGRRLLAERVETVEVHKQCKAMGFTLFQGYYYSRPETISKKEIPVGQVSVIRLMNLLQSVNANDRKIVETFQADIALSYKLLRIVNSASFGGRGIESIQHAMLLVGRQSLHRWLSLLLVSSLAITTGMDQELAHVAIRRARMCELLGEASGQRSMTGALFLVGLFSKLDALLRIPMDEILSRLDLADEVRSALLDRSGPYAGALELVEGYESGDWELVTRVAQTMKVDALQVPSLYLDSLTWAYDRMKAAND